MMGFGWVTRADASSQNRSVTVTRERGWSNPTEARDRSAEAPTPAGSGTGAGDGDGDGGERPAPPSPRVPINPARVGRPGPNPSMSGGIRRRARRPWRTSRTHHTASNRTAPTDRITPTPDAAVLRTVSW